MKASRGFLTILLLLLPYASVSGWNSAGHMAIASVAYRELTPEQRKAVSDVLAHHPAFEKWAHTYQDSNEDVDFGEFLVMKAATWPDEIRRRGGDTAQFDHPDWHFIDYPLHPTGFQEIAGPKPDDDVLFGIQQAREALIDPSTDAQLQAVFLSWAIHLIGDIHQPLHCASLFNDSYPNGDNGGNLFWVKPARRAIKLHAFWDGLLGSSANPRTAHNVATVLRNEHPQRSLAEAAAVGNPVLWSKESRKAAIETAYLSGNLQGSTDSANAADVPGDYPRNCQVVARTQAAIAAYRLTNFLVANVQPRTPEE